MLKFLVISKNPHLAGEDPTKYFVDYYEKSKTYFTDFLPTGPVFENNHEKSHEN